MKNENAAVEECRQALESCPHHQGTVRVMCRVCMGEGMVFAWDIHQAQFLSIDCPRCSDNGALEVCPCLEPYDRDTISQAIEDESTAPNESWEPREEERIKVMIPDEEKAEDNDDGDEADPLREALQWMPQSDSLGASVEGSAAAEHLKTLRAWAEEHMEIRIPHPKAALISHLIDHDMIEFVIAPETGKLVLHAKGAKEEFCRFMAALNRRYRHDTFTVVTMLCFAYGIVNWEFDPAQLQQYERGNDTIEINTDGYDLIGSGGLLHGDDEEIKAVIRSAFGC